MAWSTQILAALRTAVFGLTERYQRKVRVVTWLASVVSSYVIRDFADPGVGITGMGAISNQTCRIITSNLTYVLLSPILPASDYRLLAL